MGAITELVEELGKLPSEDRKDVEIILLRNVILVLAFLQSIACILQVLVIFWLLAR
jgi:hypothetical protein